MKIGVISDTHGLLRPEVVALFAGVERIIHAGDIGNAEVIAELEKIAPVVAVRGNNDTGGWAAKIPDDAVVTLGKRRIYVLHNVAELNRDPVTSGFDVIVSGHSHKPKAETIDGVLYLNPGSAGPRRFTLPIALAVLDVTAEAIRPHVHEIVT